VVSQSPHACNTVDKTTVKRAKIAPRKVLTVTAKNLITKQLEEGKFKDRERSVEPPYMAPNPNPNEYSHVRVVARFHPGSTDFTVVVHILQGLRGASRAMRGVQSRHMLHDRYI